MASLATEVATLPLSPRATIEDASSSAGKTWKSIVDTILAQEGCQHVYWGRQVETPNTLDLFIDWDSVGSHKKFMAAPTYGPFIDKFSSILDGEITLYHAHFTPHTPSSALSRTPQSTTEYITFYFPSNLSEHDISSWDQVFSKFTQTLTRHADGFIAFASGWVVEELYDEAVMGNAAVFAAVFEWNSVESHNKYRETKEFKESIIGLRNASKARYMHHVTFQTG